MEGVNRAMSESIGLVRKEQVAEGTMAFTFSRPAQFEFRAGQAMDLTLIDLPQTDAEGDVRTFTIASAPSTTTLMIATPDEGHRVQRVLHAAAPGLTLKLEGPSGSFNLHKNVAKPAVLLAGGIGVTPFLSIVRQAVKDGARGASSSFLFQPASGRHRVSERARGPFGGEAGSAWFRR